MVMSSGLHPFLLASTWRRDDATRFVADIDEAWLQGRGAYGGLISAGALRAMMNVVDDARRAPRTLDVHFCAPARPGPLVLEVAVERTGSTVCTVSCRGRQEGQVVCLATAAFAFPRPGVEAARFAARLPPTAPVLHDVEPVPEDLPLMPRFARFFEYRFCVGSPPYGGAHPAQLGGWIRPRPALGAPLILDAPLVAALIDAWPPAIFARLDAPRGAASVNLTVDFHAPLPRAQPGEAVLFAAESDNGDGGTCDEHAWLWAEDGTHLASCRQFVAIL